LTVYCQRSTIKTVTDCTRHSIICERREKIKLTYLLTYLDLVSSVHQGTSGQQLSARMIRQTPVSSPRSTICGVTRFRSSWNVLFDVFFGRALLSVPPIGDHSIAMSVCRWLGTRREKIRRGLNVAGKEISSANGRQDWLRAGSWHLTESVSNRSLGWSVWFMGYLAFSPLCRFAPWLIRIRPLFRGSYAFYCDNLFIYLLVQH